MSLESSLTHKTSICPKPFSMKIILCIVNGFHFFLPCAPLFDRIYSAVELRAFFVL